MNVAQLIRHLSTCPPDAPVVMTMEDDPLGDYEVLAVDREQMQHDRTYDHCGMRVYNSPACATRDRGDPPQEVVVLSFDGPGRVTVDATPVLKAIDAG